MAKGVGASTVADQIYHYKLQFTLFREYFEELRNFTPNDSNSKYLLLRKYSELGWENGHWNWDEEWDGNLVHVVDKLDKAGLTVSKFMRSRKILISGIKGLSQPELFAKIHAISGDIANVKFSSSSSAWIQLKKPKGKNIRG